MNTIIGRKEEIKKLQALLDSTEAELLAIYGRRRIGKTYLISEFFRDKGIYFELTGATGGKMIDQLRRFPIAFYEAFMSPDILTPPKDWTEAFLILLQKIKEIPENRKIILFLDELPWLATPRSDLLFALEHAWNRYFSRRKNLIMILCGSAASWMINKIINNRAGLYGRLTEKIQLQPFSLLETEYYLQSKNIHLDRKQIVEIYMVTGGTAKYLNHIKKGLSSSQIIQSLCFSAHGFLATEFRRLFESLFTHSKRHISVLEALAGKRQGLTLSDLTKLTSLSSGGSLSEIMNELECSGFIQFVPFYNKNKRDGHYRIIDEYSLFYLSWIKTALFFQNKPISENYWLNLHRSPKFLNWAGYAFENICFKHIDRIIETLKISVVAKSVSYWAYHPKKAEKISGAQIDLIIDRSDNCINLCEIKFLDSKLIMKREYAEKMNRKRTVFQSVTKTKKTLFNTIITSYGAIENTAYHSCIDQQLDMNSLFTF